MAIFWLLSVDFPVSPTEGALPHTARSQGRGLKTVWAHVPWKGCPPITEAVSLPLMKRLTPSLSFFPLRGPSERRGFKLDLLSVVTLC